MMILGYLVPARLVQCVLSAFAIVGVFFAWLATHDAKVVSNERARVFTKGEKTRVKAQAARAAVAASDGSLDRLHSKYCRDCGND